MAFEHKTLAEKYLSIAQNKSYGSTPEKKRSLLGRLLFGARSNTLEPELKELIFEELAILVKNGVMSEEDCDGFKKLDGDALVMAYDEFHATRARVS